MNIESTLKNWLRKASRSVSIAALVFALIAMVVPADLAAQRKGGSFGGRRSYSAPRSAPRSSPRGGGSFGGSRQRSTSPYSSRPSTRPQRTPVNPSRTTAPQQTNSFGGSRLATSKEYTSRYGIPRRTETKAVPSGTGTSTNYVFNRYGGMSDGYMMGYVMGMTPWFYHTPFHPAFYYSRPYTVANADGTVAVYPGTFQWGTIFFMVLLLAGGVYIVYVWVRQKRERHRWGGADMSRSSFG